MGLCISVLYVYFKQKTAYEVRISDWSSDVCSSDLAGGVIHGDRGVDLATAFCCRETGRSGVQADLAHRHANVRARALHIDFLRAPIGSASCRERLCQYV